MLKFMGITIQFFKFIQNGFYLDFFIKKIAEIFVRNYFIYTAQFFGEKYIIEFLTKKTIDSWIFNKNKIFGFFEFTNSFFFIQFISFLFFFISFFFILFI